MNTNLLNQVKSLILSHANENGIDLASEFEARSDFVNFVISCTLKSILDLGVPVDQAWDIVMGDGSFESLADDVWTQMQAA